MGRMITGVAASIGVAASALCASATISYEYGVNAYGIGWVKYSASDAGGTNAGDYYVFSGSTTMQSPNGANKVRIDFSILWGYNITTLAQKSAGMNAGGAAARVVGDTYTFSGTLGSFGDGVYAETTVLTGVTLDQIALPAGQGLHNLAGLESAGLVSSSNVAFHRSYGPSMFSTAYGSASIDSIDLDHTVFHGYVSEVPAPGAAGMLVCGAVALVRRRR